MKNIELLSPAGDYKRLEYAVAFGADAVYLGSNMFTMRTNPSNFNPDELKQAADFVHSHGKKIYLTCNTLPRNNEIDLLPDFLSYAEQIGIDAFIIADLGVMELAKKYVPDVDIHMSTQVGIVNFQTAQTLYNLGAKRIVTARELSLDEIKTIRDKTPPDLEIEVFVHGAMCMSFSGRCILSDYMAARDPNRGECAQPCRWKYHLVEKKRHGEFFPIEQDDKGTYIFNSRDLCMLEHIPELADAGVDSFKIEGRAKTEYYTAVVTNAYRNALDEYYKSPYPDFKPSDWILSELEKVSHRQYTTGFNFGQLKNGQVLDNGGYIRNWEFCAVCESCKNSTLTVFQRNRFYSGESLEVLEPGKKPYKITVSDLYSFKDGEYVSVANKAAETYSFSCDTCVSAGAMLRREITE
ncbi:MAG: U32 family peptidase [Clostridiales bacterium]|nr:U32 family peptidase [Clostridiales bacterium]